MDTRARPGARRRKIPVPAIHETSRLCYALLIRGAMHRRSEQVQAPQRHAMLPNFKIVIGAVLLSVIMFAMTGAGVVMPVTYTRVGEMPQIGRPMMQRMITDEPEQARFHVLSLERRAGELDRLRELVTLNSEPELAVAPAAQKPFAPEPAAVGNPEPDIAPVLAAAKNAETLVEPSIVPGIASEQLQAAASQADGVPGIPTPAETRSSEQTVAALPATPPDDAVRPRPPSRGQVWLPRLRPVARVAAPIPRRVVFHRVYRVVHAPPADPGLFGSPSLQSR
jgi:hypothetical protein